jgi:RNA polymerase sigma factor (TIGR02999 family)
MPSHTIPETASTPGCAIEEGWPKEYTRTRLNPARSVRVVTQTDRGRAVVELVERSASGDPGALDELVTRLYEELHAIAGKRRAQWRGDDTLSTTVLVNEAYLRLAAQEDPDWSSRAHFLAVASRAMRQVLIGYARKRGARKRGGGWERMTFDRAEDLLPALAGGPVDRSEALLKLEACLQRLEAHSERHARIVECRFFGGMTTEESAAALGVSTATVKRGWAAARAWLHREMGAGAPTAHDPR